MTDSRPLKRQQRTVGAIVKIPLEDGFHTYARILEVRCAFYDARSQEDMSIEEIIEKPILFFASVHDSAITKGYWQKIGKKLPLEDKVLNQPPVYLQNVLNPNKYEIHDKNGGRPATKEECIGLESAVSWTYDSMEERLNDYYSGRYNRFVDFMLNASMADFFRQKPKPQPQC